MTTLAPAVPGTSDRFVDKVRMQHRLFAELSRMFGQEVPLYDKSLACNLVCNRAVCEVLAKRYGGFAITDEQLDRASGERHGAIRIGRPDEYRWIARFFAAFAMEPHNFYDMTAVGAKSQPIIATAFRSRRNPEHRVFTSLLRTDYFDGATRDRIERLMAGRSVFSDRAKQLIEKGERQGGLEEADAEALIREGCDRIFTWTGRARDHGLYRELCDAGFKIAADIACFESHHLNHLTPNTLCMDLYTAAMKHCMGELDASVFRARAVRALSRLAAGADRHYMTLHFKNLTAAEVGAFTPGTPAAADIDRVADALLERLGRPDLRLSELKHSGFKDTTEGPAWDTPVLLRQDSYKALTEPVTFTNPDGTTVKTVHTARFGEIEQRFYATTPAGRALYDECLARAEARRDADPGLASRDFDAYESAYAAAFAPFPKSVPALIDRGLIYARYTATPAGLAARGRISTADRRELLAMGYLDAEGLRYEDFLPVSAAGIFASNLNQYGTKSTAASRPAYTQATLESVIGRPIIDADAQYRGEQARSLLEAFEALGVIDRLPPAERDELRLHARDAG